MTDQAQLSIRQFVNAWRIVCGASSRHAITIDDGIAHVFSGLPLAFFNIAFLTGNDISDDELEASGHRACAWAADKGVPWFLTVTHETLQDGVDAAAVLEACDLAPVMPLTGMHATSLEPATRASGSLRLTTPKDDVDCAALIAVNSRAYGMDLAAAGDVLGRQSFWRAHFPVVGMADAKPASCAAVMMVDGHRYVALVATDPEQQRRGYAEAAMRRALVDAAAVHGEQPTVLHATEAGRPVYERMGYTAIARHTIFMEKRFLAEH